MNQRLGRALGSGRLSKEQRGSGPARWVLDWTDASGARRRQSLSTDRRVAERLRTEIIHRRDMELGGLGPEAGQSRPIQELLDAYVADLSTRSVPRHHQMVKARLGRILQELRVRTMNDLEPYKLIQHRSRRLAEGLSPRSANLECDNVRALCSWCVRVGLTAANPVVSLPRLPEKDATKRHRRRAMTEAEIEAFLAAAEEDDRENLARLRANGSESHIWTLRSRGMRIPQAPFWRTLIETGGRFGEITRARWSDLECQLRTLTLRSENTKSGKERVIPLRTSLVRELEALRELHARVLGKPDRIFLSPEGYAWPESTVNAMRIFNRLLIAAGIERLDANGRKLDIHALRHTMASRLARNGVGLVQAQRLLGHSDPKLTATIYSHLDIEDLRAAIERVSDRREDRLDPQRDHPRQART
jgi:integrase